MKTYIPNNINFRIVSSNALAKFKQDQAYDFNEINQNRDTFSDASKEIILLEYDHWFKWLVRLEKVFLMAADDTSYLLKKVETLFVSEMEDLKDVTGVHTEYFPRESLQFTNYMHQIAYDAFGITVKKALETGEVFSAYPIIVTFISDYLQQLLKGLEELEFICKNKEQHCILNHTNSAVSICKLSGICFPSCRAIYFSNKYNINLFNIINHTQTEIPETCFDGVKRQNCNIEFKIGV